MDDLISRQAAIDAMESAEWYHQNQNKDMVRGANSAEHQAWYKAEDVYRVLEQLPYAQPEILQDGTLMIDVPDLNTVNRIIVSSGKMCKVFYLDDSERRTDGV